MEEYHKIQTVFHRNPDTKFKTLIEGKWSRPEFYVLKDIQWVCTEKIDGTNIRVIWDGENVSFKGKTDNAEIPNHLLETLEKTFTKDKMLGKFNDTKVCLYGEGYGNKIQKNGKHYISNNADFILFDVKIGNWWLERVNVKDIAKDLNIKVVPIILLTTLTKAIELVKNDVFKSKISENKDLTAEGLIMTPTIQLFDRKGERIITKLKFKDFNRQ